MKPEVEAVLHRVQKPARYTGGEYNEIIKDKENVRLRVAFCFPDTYEIGMSNLGMKILYHTMNTPEDIWCERVFAPWEDMYREMKDHQLPLYGLESGDPLTEFDAIAFSVGYEMAYTTVLDMIDMAGLPVRSEDRTELLPLVFAGGNGIINPEPMAPFLDLFVIGEGEEMNNELLTLLKTAKEEHWSKQDFLKEAAQIDGVYVPSLHNRTIKRIVKDLDNAPYPVHPVVPSTEVVQDRVNLELFRGCTRGCRFCQAGHLYRPIRAKTVETLTKQCKEALKNTGYNEVTLLSLSSSDYSGLEELIDSILPYCEERKIGISLPSLRADNFSMNLMQKLQKVRKSSLTFAVEAGTQRLRDVINKNVTEEDLLQSCRIAFEGGSSAVKLYFMLGLPTETDEDVVAIARLADQVLHTWREYAVNKSRGVRITISTSCFIPKPFSPFQWVGQISMEEYMRRVNLLRSSIHAKNVVYNWHDAQTSLIEAVLSRGDRKVADVIERVWRTGGRLEAWSDFFSFDRWMQAFADTDTDYASYAGRERSYDEVLPWDVIDTGVTKEHLIREAEKAKLAQVSHDCKTGCSLCGASALLAGGHCNV